MKRFMGMFAIAGLAAVIGGCNDGNTTVVQQHLTAYCTDMFGHVVLDSDCTGNSDPSGIFIYGGQHYHYYYGNRPLVVGAVVSGGSYTAPRTTNITIVNRSGNTITRTANGSVDVKPKTSAAAPAAKPAPPKSPTVTRGGLGAPKAASGSGS